MDYKEILAQFQDEFDATEVDENGEYVRPWKNGETFEATITACRVGNAPWDNDGLWLYVAFEDDGKKDDYYRSLQPSGDKAFNALKKALIGLGYTGRLVDLPDSTEDIIGRRIQMKYSVTKGKDKSYHNYFFNKCLSDSTSEVEDLVY